MKMKSFIKKIVSEETRKKLSLYYFRLQTFKRAFSIKLSKLFSVTNFTSVLFYLFTGEFGREAKSSLRGRQQYIKSAELNTSLYRRNVHRLEKAMIMRPRREKFAADYIYELVCSHAVIKDKVSHEQYEWGSNVLNQYFSLVSEGLSSEIDKARGAFLKLDEQSMQSDTTCKVPFSYADRELSTISYEEFYSLTKARKSIRWFEEKEVELELIKKAADVASQAPSACNRQPFNFYFTNNSAKAREIASLAMGSAGFINNIPSIIAVVGDLSYYDCAHDRHVIYIDSSLATMQMILAFETLGLSSCVLNWPDVKERDEKLSKYLGLEDHQRVICLIAVGYADETGLTPYSEKKSSSELIKEI